MFFTQVDQKHVKKGLVVKSAGLLSCARVLAGRKNTEGETAACVLRWLNRKDREYVTYCCNAQGFSRVQAWIQSLCRGCQRVKRSAFITTLTEDSAMASAAIMGLNHPMAASGMQTVL